MKIQIQSYQYSRAGCLIFFLLISGLMGFSQSPAQITEYKQAFKTYAFDDPDPVPILASNPKIYPYFRYEGYRHNPEMKEWKVVKLENDNIEVYVLPEVGGKVWGAIEKSTGEEFIYRNEVMKFRNISMRGPWTSGGIEFNFGIIGHHPSTATPVDYYTQTYDDGSVSCIVGAIDLPSHTQWRVEIYLAPGKAYFETRVLWYNPTHQTQSYYNWMTGAAVATQDLEFFCPGNAYVGHPGDEHPWPVDDQGRKLSRYKENNFGGSKSYHVVGEYNDFFGGYYHDRQFGFGHWSPYDEMPGQKLWLWALSRSGGIWEDLLTDSDGQYIEFQAGRLFNQFSPGRVKTPITQADFEPGRSDLWREIWFPVKEIGGLSDVSPKGILHVRELGDSLEIGINALEKSMGHLIVKAGNAELLNASLELMPMDVRQIRIRKPGSDYQISVREMDLHFGTGDQEGRLLDRPFVPNENGMSGDATSADQWYRQGMEQLEFREYPAAEASFLKCLDLDAGHLGSLNALADIKWRNAHYEKALEYIRQSLKEDTYDPEANFLAGNIYRALEKDIDALECYGWAARSLKYRADAYAAMAEIQLKNGAAEEASRYARNALDFNRFHIVARMVLIAAARISGNTVAAIRQIGGLRALDPLNHFAKMEQYLISKLDGDKQAVLESHRSELPHQTYLELAIRYFTLGLKEDAIAVLELAPQHPLIDLWWSYLMNDKDERKSAAYLQAISDQPAELVFPYRAETLKVLEWATSQHDTWQLQYYLALNHWALGHKQEALVLFKKLPDNIDFAPFYLTRAALRSDLGEPALPDIEHALQINRDNWRAWNALLGHYEKQGMKDKFLVAAKEAHERLPHNYAIEMLYAKALLDNQQYLAAIDALKSTHVLPYEGASQGRRLWEDAHLAAGLSFVQKGDYLKAIDLLEASQTWPENLGVGKPYNPDERISDYLLAFCYQKTDKSKLAEKHIDAIRNFRKGNELGSDLKDLISLKVEKINQRPIMLHDGTRPGRRGQILSYLKAFNEGNTQQMQDIEKGNPELFSNLTFQIIKSAIDLP